MSLTDRDRKIVFFVLPLVLILAYWFLLLAPKREEAADAAGTLAKAEERLDSAESQIAQTQRAKTSFAADYADLVRLGKAIPTSVDMPSLIVQLDSAARGTHIKFRKIATSTEPGAPAPAPPPTPAPGTGNGSQPAAAGGPAAQSGPGKATESAGNASQASSSSNAAKEAKSGGVDTQTSTSQGKGLPVGGGSAAAAASGQNATCAPGLVCVPLTMEFTGGFFDLTDFFHKLKRFVKVANQDLKVSGRLMTVDSLKFTSDELSFPDLAVEIGATVYLAPKTEGTTAGATPQGPASTVPAASSSSGTTPAPASTGTAPTP